MPLYIGNSKVGNLYVGSAATDVTNITLNNPTLSINTNTGIVTATITNSTAGYLEPTTKSSTLSLTTKAATTITPTNSSQTAVAKNVYTTGVITVAAVPTETKSISSNGTYTPTSGKFFSSVTVNVSGGGGTTINNQNKTVTPTESLQSITADSGYTGLGTVTINAITATYVGSGIDRRSSSNLTASGATVSVPAGYYEITASKSIANGSEGIPTATKGTVSNHSISVTPSVTNTAGYISGSTKTGTAITVSANELVSGSQTITSNNTYDVTNLANVIVNVAGSGSSNFVQGEFTTQATAGVQSITIPYSGSGYPIMAYFCIKGGAYVSGTTWYNSTQRYAIGVWAMSKSVMSSDPSYTTSGTNNQAVTMSIYKNSTTSATTYTRTSAMNTNTFSSSNATNAAATAVRFKSNTSLSIYVNTSSYGLFPSADYEYYIVYSS